MTPTTSPFIREHGIGQHSHESDARPAVDDAQPALDRRTRELARRRGIYL